MTTMPRLSLVDELILSEVQQQGTVSNLAALARSKFVDYRNAHRRVSLLKAAGMLEVEYQPKVRGRLLVLSRGANSVHQLTFGGALAAANGIKARRE